MTGVQLFKLHTWSFMLLQPPLALRISSLQSELESTLMKSQCDSVNGNCGIQVTQTDLGTMEKTMSLCEHCTATKFREEYCRQWRPITKEAQLKRWLKSLEKRV